MQKNKLIAAMFAVLFLGPVFGFASVAGSLDKLFDSDGRVTLPNGTFSIGRDVAVQPDGKTDIDFFRQSTGFWYVLRSEDGSFFSFPLGAAGDVAIPSVFIP